MARTILTESDIEDLARRGVTTIDADDNVYITDVARERMEQLGMRVRSAAPQTLAPGSAAPSTLPSRSPSGTPAVGSGGLTEPEKQEVIERVKSGVIARLGPGVDVALVDQIVRRVVGQL